jgi:hypothetical protein
VTWMVSEAESSSGSRPRLALCWRESGVPLLGALLPHRGYGRELIEHALPYTLDGETSLEFTREGVHAPSLCRSRRNIRRSSARITSAASTGFEHNGICA